MRETIELSADDVTVVAVIDSSEGAKDGVVSTGQTFIIAASYQYTNVVDTGKRQFHCRRAIPRPMIRSQPGQTAVLFTGQHGHRIRHRRNKIFLSNFPDTGIPAELRHW